MLIAAHLVARDWAPFFAVPGCVPTRLRCRSLWLVSSGNAVAAKTNPLAEPGQKGLCSGPRVSFGPLKMMKSVGLTLTRELGKEIEMEAYPYESENLPRLNTAGPELN